MATPVSAIRILCANRLRNVAFSMSVSPPLSYAGRAPRTA
jgi:hypothetical protein